ncbi:hypothetical protein NHX12_026244 [Muraenolepis orangiensis]|uniref:Transmembrane protein 200A n=1 Tax=Muraenolepis orangiensis TaxID=630683 RepID=A0A9Q0EJX4_9TELE|nr:hypothetical protein NHX12_026244 [Muraenolepis orangiensis]
MTAAVGVLTGLAKLKHQDSGPGNPPPEAAPRRRKRRSDIVVVRGRLHLYSASGFFLMLGLLILAVGIAMATLGYWPHSDSVRSVDRKAADAPGGGGGQASGSPGGMLRRFLEQHRHSERMKMFGPFTMGIGIFIFICANVIHMRDMYSTVIDIHRLRQRESKHLPHNGSFSGEHGADSSGAACLASPALLAFSSRGGMGSLGEGGGGGGRGSTEEEEVLLGEGEDQMDFGLGGFLAPFYKDRHPLGRLDPSRRQWSADREGGGGHRARSIVSSSLSAFTLPVIKLNNCVIDEPEMEAITEEERGGAGAGGGGGGGGGEGQSERCLRALGSMESLGVPVATVAKASKPPGLHRSNSASLSSRCSSSSSSSYSCSAGSSLSPALPSSSGCWLSPGAARGDFGSNNSLHMLGSHSKSLDLERRPGTLRVQPGEQRKHPSWPRLDRSNSGRGCSIGRSGSTKGYARLEDREEQTGCDRQAAAAAAAAVAARRDYSKREKLLMISRSHNNLSFEHDDVNSSTLKRGSSESRF